MTNSVLSPEINHLIDRENSYFVLGAIDPEMLSIKELLTKHGFRTVQATIDGEYVNHVNANDADGIDSFAEGEAIFVETRVKGLKPIRIVDHHSESDESAKLPPEKAFEASSIGQIAALLSLDISQIDHKFVVAGVVDHNFNAVYRGMIDERYKVSPEEALDTKIESIARTFTDNMNELESLKKTTRDKIQEYEGVISRAPSIQLGKSNVVDLRHVNLGSGYSFNRLCAQVASVTNEKAVLLWVEDDREGWLGKVTLNGNVPPGLVDEFLEWANDPERGGLVDVYSVRSRGYAGGFKRQAQLEDF